jgi:hypothetical protein
MYDVNGRPPTMTSTRWVAGRGTTSTKYGLDGSPVETGVTDVAGPAEVAMPEPQAASIASGRSEARASERRERSADDMVDSRHDGLAPTFKERAPHGALSRMPDAPLPDAGGAH